MKKIFAAGITAIVLVTASWAAAADEAAGDAKRQQEAVRKASEDVQKELEENRDVLNMIIKEVLAEARKNKTVLKEVFKELGKEKTQLQEALRELANDPELRKNLNELGEILRDTTKELTPSSGGKEGAGTR